MDFASFSVSLTLSFFFVISFNKESCFSGESTDKRALACPAEIVFFISAFFASPGRLSRRSEFAMVDRSFPTRDDTSS